MCYNRDNTYMKIIPEEGFDSNIFDGLNIFFSQSRPTSNILYREKHPIIHRWNTFFKRNSANGMVYVYVGSLVISYTKMQVRNGPPYRATIKMVYRNCKRNDQTLVNEHCTIVTCCFALFLNEMPDELLCTL